MKSEPSSRKDSAMTNTASRSLDDALPELLCAEDFLEYFQIPYERPVVEVKRLHILQRFHDYLDRHADEMPKDEAGRAGFYRSWLCRAYEDFTHSDAQTEKVFAVFRHVPNEQGGTTTFIPLEKIFR
jgi:nitrogenase-stabilizing/protective protein